MNSTVTTLNRKLYLCGPISIGGTLPEEQVIENLNRFNEYEIMLAKVGYRVESPVRIKEAPWLAALELSSKCEVVTKRDEWCWYLRRTLIQMLTCDGVALLPGWQASPGCRLEVHLADSIDLYAQSVQEWLKAAYE